jgi:hypothetical protein
MMEKSPFETDGPKQIDMLLTFFFWECPTSMIPSRPMVREWIEILERRGPEFTSAVAACREFLNQ